MLVKLLKRLRFCGLESGWKVAGIRLATLDGSEGVRHGARVRTVGMP
jgi:hypothetical protein